MKTDFDLMFGPYYDTATQSGVTIPYLVRGALQNYGSTEMYLETELSFEQVGYNQINFQNFSSRRDVVGYNWKDPIIDGSSAFYQLRPNYTYVIKTFEGNYFKMRFLGYELNGDNGYPKFETVELRFTAEGAK